MPALKVHGEHAGLLDSKSQPSWLRSPESYVYRILRRLAGKWLSSASDIFPRSKLVKDGVAPEIANHYANFHFLRGEDNLNKSDTAPHLWFEKPGNQAAYTDEALNARLLTRDLLQPGAFPQMLAERTRSIQERALTLFGLDSPAFDALFSTSKGL